MPGQIIAILTDANNNLIFSVDTDSGPVYGRLYAPPDGDIGGVHWEPDREITETVNRSLAPVEVPEVPA